MSLPRIRLSAGSRPGVSRAARALAAALLLVASSAAAQEPAAAPPGWLGVWLHCDSCVVPERAGQRTWRFHALPVIVEVLANSPAGRAGLAAGDTLVRIDGVALDSDEGGRRFGALREGQRVTLVVRRNGAERAVGVVPGRRPEQVEARRTPMSREKMDSLRLVMRVHLDSLREHLQSLHERWRAEGMRHDSLSQERERWIELYRDSIRFHLDSLAIHVLPAPRAAPRAPAVPYRYEYRYGDTVPVPVVAWNAVAGAQMTSLGEELAEYFPGSEGGVLVLRVLDGTPAAGAGLKPGDVIVAVRGARVRSVDDVRKALKPYPRPVQCDVVRKGKKLTVTIQGSTGPAVGPSGPSAPRGASAPEEL